MNPPVHVNSKGGLVTPSTPDSFNYETKYIVLNFMSMIPDRYTSNPHTPLTSTSESDPFMKKYSKSQSLPSSPPKHRYRKLSSKKYSHPERLPPQASEDNVGYRYQRETKKYLKHNGNDEVDQSETLENSLNISNDDNSKSNRMTDFKPHGRGSFDLSQFRQRTMGNRADSEMSNWTSDCTDYTSDADDEEETSNASSVLASLSWPGLRRRSSGGEVDITQVIPRLPTVPSESEMENGSVSSHLESPGFDALDVQSKVSKSPIDISDVQIDVVGLGGVESQENFDNDYTESGSVSINIGGSSSNAVRLDRSKLRLDIPDQEEMYSLENRKLERLLANMRAELEDEITSFESEVDDAIKKQLIDPVESPFGAPVSPQTAAARVLARIGDEVKDHYEQRLQEAIGHLFAGEHLEYLNYDEFRRVANEVVDQNLPGWRQVALMLLYGQSAAWRAVESGFRGIGDFVDYTTRLIADSCAVFIIQQGGWGAVMNFDPSQSSESPLSPDSLKDIPSLLEDSLHHTIGNTDSEREDSPLIPTSNHSMSNSNPYKKRDEPVESPYFESGLDDFMEEASDVEEVEETPKLPFYELFGPWDWFHVAVCFLHFISIGIYTSVKSSR